MSRNLTAPINNLMVVYTFIKADFNQGQWWDRGLRSGTWWFYKCRNFSNCERHHAHTLAKRLLHW